MPDVVIIGAGVVGTSIAFNLARKGCNDVVILEKDGIGSGATDKCAGGIRQQFSTEPNIKLSRESLHFFERFEEETGCPADFRQHGYLILATGEADLQTLRRNVIVQRAMGVQVELLERSDIVKLVPGLQVDDIPGAAFCPSDGYADPYSVVTGFASAAKKLGVTIYENTEVTCIELNNRGISGMTTNGGTVSAPVVVNAAGPYAAVVGSMAGIKIPISPVRRHIVVSEPVVDLNVKFRNLPVVVEFGSGFWFRREGICFTFGMRDPDEKSSFNTTVNWDYLNGTMFPAACHRLPLFLETGIRKAEAGLHCDAPDYNAILGPVEMRPGLYLACGFSGHGFMHAPAVGRLMADLILGEPSSESEVKPFLLSRFEHPVEEREKTFF